MLNNHISWSDPEGSKMKVSVWVAALPLVAVLSGCGFDGGPVFSENFDHKVNMGGDVADSLPLSVRVKQALRANPQTTLSQIHVSSVSDDSVKLAGNVDNDAIRQEAERVAGQVEGVRFVVNSLNIR